MSLYLSPNKVLHRHGLRSAAYDYYPFGMLMPHRYHEDNTVQCAQTTISKYTPVLVPFVTHTLQTLNSGLTAANANTTLTAGDQGTTLTPTSTDMPISAELPLSNLQANTLHKVELSITNESTQQPAQVYLKQLIEGEWITIASSSVAAATRLTLEGTSLNATTAKLVISGLGGDIHVSDLQGYYQHMEQSTSNVLLCNLDPDFSDDYRFGFNGQHKENEVAGVGNHNTALFWEYDTRLGRRWNLDPVDQISISNYATFANNPISFSDLLGDQVDKDRTKGKNFIVVASKQLRKEDVKKHGFFAAFRMDYIKAKTMSILSFGKTKVIQANDAQDMTDKIKAECGSKGYVKNLTVDFHSRFIGADNYANDPSAMQRVESAVSELGNGYAGSGSTTCFLGMCWSGGNSDLTDPEVTHTPRVDMTASFSKWLDGSTTYGPQFATSSGKFLFFNHFEGITKESYSKDPGNKTHLGLYTVTSNGISSQIANRIKITNFGRIRETHR